MSTVELRKLELQQKNELVVNPVVFKHLIVNQAKGLRFTGEACALIQQSVESEVGVLLENAGHLAAHRGSSCFQPRDLENAGKLKGF